MNRKEILISFIGALFGIILTAIYDWVKDKPIFSTVWNFLKWIWFKILEFEIRLWQLILIVFVIYIIRKIIKTKSNNIENPKFLSYTTDNIHFFNWKWSWGLNPRNDQWNITDIKPICPKCQTMMHYEYSTMYYKYIADCPRCKFTNNQIAEIKDIEAIIIDNIRRGIY